MDLLLAVNDDLEARVTALESQIVKLQKRNIKNNIFHLSDSLAVNGDGPAE